jgi:hypothetical protein
MGNRLSELEDTLGETGLVHEKLLEFVRLLPSNDVATVQPMLKTWADSIRAAGVEVDEQWLQRILNDLSAHGRILPETIMQAPARPDVTLGKSK